MKQNSLFTVQCPSADMRGHSEMLLERSMGVRLNEQPAMVYECKMCLRQKRKQESKGPGENCDSGTSCWNVCGCTKIAFD